MDLIPEPLFYRPTLPDDEFRPFALSSCSLQSALVQLEGQLPAQTTRGFPAIEADSVCMDKALEARDAFPVERSPLAVPPTLDSHSAGPRPRADRDCHRAL